VVSDCNGELLFDLSKVTFIDSEAIKTLLCAFHKMGQKRGRARIVQCSRRAMRVMKLAGVDSILNVNQEATDAPVVGCGLPDLEARKQRVHPLHWVARPK
jgi:anti-anti-sigma regulatory factor